MLDFSRFYASSRESLQQAIARVCDSQGFILGPEVEAFEQAAAEACRARFAVGCSSGTDAIWLALAAAGIGDSTSSVRSADPPAVLTTPFTFFATASAILRAGARPVFADIDPHSFNLSPDAVAQALRRRSGVAAILPVHLYGQCAEMDALLALAGRHGIPVVEDAAQAFGAEWQGRPAGSLGLSAAFSFYPTKNLAAFGEAGLVTTGEAGLADRLRSLRSHGMVERYRHEEVGWNARMDAFQAAVLRVKLQALPAGNDRRRKLADRYGQLFQAAGLAAASVRHGLVLPSVDARGVHVFHQYVVRAPRRGALRSWLTQHRIGSEIYYPIPLHLQPALRGLGYRAGDFPESEAAAAEVLALPLYPELREDEQDTVVEAIRRFFA